MGVVATSYNAGQAEEDMLAQCRGQQTAREAPVEYLNKGHLTGFNFVGGPDDHTRTGKSVATAANYNSPKEGGGGAQDTDVPPCVDDTQMFKAGPDPGRVQSQRRASPALDATGSPPQDWEAEDTTCLRPVRAHPGLRGQRPHRKEEENDEEAEDRGTERKTGREREDQE